VHILLPPSEKKATEGDGPPLDLASLSFPELTAARRRVITALTRTCRRKDAPETLALPAGQIDEALARNRALKEAPALPVARLYTGVLYDNLDLPSLDAQAAAERIVVFSGLWGALRLTDRVPPYRLSMSVSLPPLGRLGTFWKPAMTKAIRPSGLIVDMRSGPYAAAWKAPRPAVAVRVFRETTTGGVPRGAAGRAHGGETQRTVVSHMAKATRGAIAHGLLKAGADPATPEELLKAVADLGFTVELNGGNLDVILPS
jgi:uncharacterized protein